MQHLSLNPPIGSISHSFEDESQEAKARWFQSLTLEERMDMLCMFTDMILSVNPTMMERKHVKPIAGRVRVITAASQACDGLNTAV
ncbi:MAG: hypothetical protein OT477_01295 [Chloroflexi bacterium]|nr:hypothetical protein [Chloroflexota bacterium]